MRRGFSYFVVAVSLIVCGGGVDSADAQQYPLSIDRWEMYRLCQEIRRDRVAQYYQCVEEGFKNQLDPELIMQFCAPLSPDSMHCLPFFTDWVAPEAGRG